MKFLKVGLNVVWQQGHVHRQVFQTFTAQIMGSANAMKKPAKNTYTGESLDLISKY